MKTTIKRTISIVLTALILLCAVPFCASAEESPAKDNLEITINTPADEYKLTDEVSFEITVKNVGDGLVTGINAGAYIDGYLMVENSQCSCSVDELSPGESASFILKAVPSNKANGLNFFAKIILFFKNLFRKTTQFPLTGIQDKYKAQQTLDFKQANCKFTVSAYAVAANKYDAAEDMTKEEIVDIYNKAIAGAQADSGFDWTSITRISIDKISTDVLSESGTLEDILAITAKGKFKVSGKKIEYDDVESAVAYKTDEGTCVRLNIKSDSADAINRAVGYNIDLKETLAVAGMEIVSGEDNLKTNYSGCVVGCTVTDDGKMVGGSWRISTEIRIGSCTIAYNTVFGRKYLVVETPIKISGSYYIILDR